MQAAGGLISMTGEPGRPGVRVGSSVIDQGTGTWAALGVLAALLDRDRSGEGSVVDVSLYETAIGYIGYHLAGYLADGTVPHGQGTRFPMVAPYQVFRTRDGELMIAGGNDRLFAAICGVVGLPALVDDPRFRSNRDRVANRDELCAILDVPLARARLGGLAGACSRTRACRRLRSPMSPTSRTHPRPRRSESCNPSPILRSPTSG